MYIGQNFVAYSATEKEQSIWNEPADVVTTLSGSSLQRVRKDNKDLINVNKWEYDETVHLTVGRDGVTTAKSDKSYQLQKKYQSQELEKALQAQKHEVFKRSHDPRTLSKKTAKKMREKITAFHVAANNQKRSLYFITVTLTSEKKIYDYEFNKYLNSLYTWIRKTYCYKREIVDKNTGEITYWSPFPFNYVHRLERQANGSLHAHIITDVFLPVYAVNRAWCKIISKAGYTFEQKDKSKCIWKTLAPEFQVKKKDGTMTKKGNWIGEGEIISPFEALKRAEKASPLSFPDRTEISKRKYKQTDSRLNTATMKNTVDAVTDAMRAQNFTTPNPVDIKRVKSFAGVQSYITKYITKTSKDGDGLKSSPIHCQLWNCSQSISKLWTTVKTNSRRAFIEISGHFTTSFSKKLDDGYEFIISLLNDYTKTQNKYFKINDPFLCYQKATLPE